MKTALLFLIVIVAAFAAYVRLAPSDPARWHQPRTSKVVGDSAGLNSFAATRRADEGSLAELTKVALATPRTRILAGSPEEGAVTFVTRSALWGFPDYTTASYEDGLLSVYGRSRFGRGDMGVNKARVSGWLASLGLANP